MFQNSLTFYMLQTMYWLIWTDILQYLWLLQLAKFWWLFNFIFSHQNWYRKNLKGLQQVKCFHPLERLCITWLGSSVGDLSKEDTVEFFKDVISVVWSTCQLLICMGFITQTCVSTTWLYKSVSRSAWACVML